MDNMLITGAQAVREALDICMEKDKTVFLMGLGVADPKRIFGTTNGLLEKFGNTRVMEMPVAENAMTGVLIGASLAGLRPILSHQRIDFSLMSIDQIFNNAAKWNYMFNGEMSVPITIRMIIGRGWGQGPQHAQNLQAIFAHVPGLKVVMPFSPADTKGLLISSIEDNNPVIFIEHRWLHHVMGDVPKGYYKIPLSKANVIKRGNDVSIIATSFMLVEALKAEVLLKKYGIDVEIIDLRTIKPLDTETIFRSVKKTGRLVCADLGYLTAGIASEISALVCENCFYDLKAPILRIATPDCPAPTSRGLIQYYYPRAKEIVIGVLKMMKINIDKSIEKDIENIDVENYDVPDKTFTGPF